MWGRKKIKELEIDIEILKEVNCAKKKHVGIMYEELRAKNNEYEALEDKCIYLQSIIAYMLTEPHIVCQEHDSKYVTIQNKVLKEKRKFEIEFRERFPQNMVDVCAKEIEYGEDR